jgi:hypothetical protein
VQDVALLDVVLISARRRHLLYAHNLDGHQLRSKALAVSVAAVGLAGALAARGNARRVGGSRGATASATGASFAPFEAPAAGLRLCRRDSVPAGERAAGRAGRARAAPQCGATGKGTVQRDYCASPHLIVIFAHVHDGVAAGRHHVADEELGPAARARGSGRGAGGGVPRQALSRARAKPRRRRACPAQTPTPSAKGRRRQPSRQAAGPP